MPIECEEVVFSKFRRRDSTDTIESYLLLLKRVIDRYYPRNQFDEAQAFSLLGGRRCDNNHPYYSFSVEVSESINVVWHIFLHGYHETSFLSGGFAGPAPSFVNSELGFYNHLVQVGLADVIYLFGVSTDKVGGWRRYKPQKEIKMVGYASSLYLELKFQRLGKYILAKKVLHYSIHLDDLVDSIVAAYKENRCDKIVTISYNFSFFGKNEAKSILKNGDEIVRRYIPESKRKDIFSSCKINPKNWFRKDIVLRKD